MNKIVVTGGAGFIGSHLAEACCQLPSQPEVVVYDNLRSGKQSNLDRLAVYPNFRYASGSILEREPLNAALEGADCVFHLAAMISVSESLLLPQECVDINVSGTLHLIEAARRHRVPKIVFSSSAAVYGEEPEQPKRESHRPAPLTPYGITKLDGEFYLDMARREYGISTTSLRYFNVFGPFQDPTSAYAAAVPIFARRARLGENITIYGDGLQTRDFIYVKDVVLANLWAAQHPELVGTYNVATGTTTTILQLAQRICEITGSTSQILHEAARPGDIRDSWADPGRLNSTGFRARYSLETGLLEMLGASPTS